MSDALFRIRNLSFAYDPPTASRTGEEVLSIDNLDLHKGKIISFRGHNGSGKTTLLKLLGRLLDPGKGRIEYEGDGQPVLVHQEPYLFHGSVRQNLLYPLRFHADREIDRNRKIKDVLATVGLQGFEKRRARELSGGEKKRVAIARALVTEPSVLLLDEPVANVDAATSRELEILLLRLKKEGMNILISTHDGSLAYRVSDEIIDLYKGKPVDHHENIFRGEYLFREGTYSQFRKGSLEFTCPSRIGDYSTAVVSSKDVYLSRDRIGKGDYNQLEGIIEDISPFKEDRYILTVNCGVQIKSHITGTAMELLEAEEGDRINALFSPSTVHLY